MTADFCCGCELSGNPIVKQITARLGLSPVTGYVNDNPPNHYAHAAVTSTYVTGWSERRDVQWDHVGMFFSQQVTHLADGETDLGTLYGPLHHTTTEVVSDSTLVQHYFYGYEGGPYTEAQTDTCVLTQADTPAGVLLAVSLWVQGFAFEQVPWWDPGVMDPDMRFTAAGLDGNSDPMYLGDGTTRPPTAEWKLEGVPWLGTPNSTGIPPLELTSWTFFADTTQAAVQFTAFLDQPPFPVGPSGLVYYGRSRFDRITKLCLLEVGVTAVARQVPRIGAWDGTWPGDPDTSEPDPSLFTELERTCSPSVPVGSGSLIINAPTPSGYRLAHTPDLFAVAGFPFGTPQPAWADKWPDCECL